PDLGERVLAEIDVPAHALRIGGARALVDDLHHHLAAAVARDLDAGAAGVRAVVIGGVHRAQVLAAAVRVVRDDVGVLAGHLVAAVNDPVGPLGQRIERHRPVTAGVLGAGLHAREVAGRAAHAGAAHTAAAQAAAAHAGAAHASAADVAAAHAGAARAAAGAS